MARAVQEEFAKRDEIILALEMLVVDQASRLLALESVVVNMAQTGDVAVKDVEVHIGREAERFRNYLEGEGLSGFLDRANRVAGELVKGGAGEAKDA